MEDCGLYCLVGDFAGIFDPVSWCSLIIRSLYNWYRRGRRDVNIQVDWMGYKANEQLSKSFRKPSFLTTVNHKPTWVVGDVVPWGVGGGGKTYQKTWEWTRDLWVEALIHFLPSFHFSSRSTLLVVLYSRRLCSTLAYRLYTYDRSLHTVLLATS
jgi:hypothetical protein